VNRRHFIASTAAPLVAKSQKKPNFLFLIADDHAGYVMGCDGNDRAETPHLDEFAASGTRFASNYCNSPVCTPSRQSFFTGQLPHAAEVTVLRTRLDSSKPTLAKQLKLAGYSTAVFGKMHFNQPGEPGLHGFDRLMTEPELNKAWNAESPSPVPSTTRTKKLPWRPFADPARIWLNADNLPYPRNPQDMRAACQLRHVDAYLQERSDKPFALWVSFLEPHSPFDFPVGAMRFEPSKFEPPAIGSEDAPQIPLIFRDLSKEDRSGIIAAYYNSVRYLDSNVGAVLQMLRRYKLDDNTFVVYMADHGYCLGHHGRFEKHCGYDPALRVPLIMRWPGHVRAGAVVRDFTESVDVPHTILDLLDAAPFAVRHGRSLRPYIEGKRPRSPLDHIFSEYLENEEALIRTATHKYVFCSGRRKRTDGYETDRPTPGRYHRLYDLRSDAGEFTDIAEDNPKVTARMQRLMLSRFRETHPDAAHEPQRLSPEESLEWYLRPRDAVQA
jgi:arylsulfatase A-like enzyme